MRLRAPPDRPPLSRQLRKKYGALPSQKALLERRLKGGQAHGNPKTYFDSADFSMDREQAQKKGVRQAAEERQQLEAATEHPEPNDPPRPQGP